MDLGAAPESDDEWELCNDDGFIYKREKRRRLDHASSAPPPVDAGEAEEEFLRGRRKKTLLRIKDRYWRELALWQHLSSSCRAIQDTADQLQQERERAEVEEEERQRHRTTPSCVPREAEVQGKDNNGGGLEALVDKLLLKAEAQEAAIEEVSNLCDIAESLCESYEEEFKQSLINLPIWAPSPHDLVAALSVQ